MKELSGPNLKKLRILLGFLIAFLFFQAVTKTLQISFTVSLIGTLIYLIALKSSKQRKSWTLSSQMPEIIDHVISGIQSGQSLNESLTSLGRRGPLICRPYFQNFEDALREGKSFEAALSQLQNEFNIRSADQLFEALLFARNLGGGELLMMLRQLGDFCRQDLSIRREISTKQGWIRNSAHLSAAAPWLLLILISTQPATGEAFRTTGGTVVLLFGAIMTAIAYWWMNRLGEIPEAKRVFGVRT